MEAYLEPLIFSISHLAGLFVRAQESTLSSLAQFGHMQYQ